MSRTLDHLLRKAQKSPLEMALGNGHHVCIHSSDEESPFILSPKMVRFLEEVPRRDDAYAQARELHEFLAQRITYGSDKSRHGYRNSTEVLEDMEGICGEMVFVYVTMARCLGLYSSYVSVRVDMRGKRVNHACAHVRTPEGGVLSDIAYDVFDVEHKKYELLSDTDAILRYKQWRQG